MDASYMGSRDKVGGYAQTVGRVGGKAQKLQKSGCEKSKGSGDAAQSIEPGVMATSHPVLIATGEKILPQGDITPMGDGVALQVVRLYTGSNSKIGAFGQSWSASFDYTLVFEYENYVCWAWLDRDETCNPNGKPLRTVHAYNPSGYATHFRLSDGVWTSDEGDTLQFVDGEWIVSYLDGSRHLFSSKGKPKKILGERGIGLAYAYDANNKLVTITHTSGRSISLTWSGGKVVAITAPNGKAYGYGYSSAGFLASVVYPDGLGTRIYHYEDNFDAGRLTGISINGVRYSRYQYLADGRVQWSGLEGGVERSNFNYLNDRTEVANALGQTTVYDIATINGARRVMGITRPPSGTCAGGVRETVYDTNGNVDYELDGDEVKTDYTYDADNRIVQKITGIGPNGETDQQQITQYIWDATRKTRLNQIKVFGTSTSQPLNTTTYTYYPDGDPRARLLQSVAVTNHGGGTVGTLTTTYDYIVHPNGLIATMTVDGPLSGTGDTVTSTYDSAGNLLEVKNSLNHATTYANYNALGQPGTITSPNGAVVSYTYNARGQVLTETRTVNGVAQTTTTTYDNRGRPIKVTTPDGNWIETNYDAYDRVTSVSKTEELEDIGEFGDLDYEYNRVETRKQAFVYNLLSQPTSETTTYRYQARMWDETRNKLMPVLYTTTQHKVSYEYDAGGFLSKRKGENGQSITYHYNANGDVDWVKDALNNTTSYAYDRHRRVSSVTDANGGVTLMGYTPLGLTALVRDARNNVTAYAYDGLGNLLSQTSPDTGMTTFTYNSAGQQTQAQRADLSTLTYSYDTLGRLVAVTGGGQSRAYSYDWCTNGKGMLCGLDGSAGVWTHFAYTPEGQVSIRHDSNAGMSYDDWTAYSYDGMGRLSGIGYPSGISVGYGYAAGNLTAITATVNGSTQTIAHIDSYQYLGPPAYMGYGNGLWRTTNYDIDRRVTGISTKHGSTPIQSLTYGFDVADRITAITNGVDANQTQQYQYDALSRLTRAELAGGNIATYGHDAVGNRTSMGNTSPASTTAYTIAGTNNRLTQAVTGSLTRSFTHNPNGDITAFTGTDGVTNTLTYDPFGRLASHTKSGATTYYTTNALDQRVAKYGPAVADTRYIYAGQNQLLAEKNANGWTSYIWNGGEPIAMVRNNQIYYLHNDHLGRPQLATNSSKAIVWKASNTAFDRSVTTDSIGGLNLGFPGQYFDAESGIWHNGYRDYLPDAGGRYLQSDPIGLRGGINTYAYVGGNPISFVDPLGLEGIGPWTFPPGPQRDAYMAAHNGARGPDFVQLSGSLYVFGGSIALSRSGNIFASGGIGRAYPNPVRGLGFSLNAGNLISNCPDAKERGAKTDKFLTGLGYSATAHGVIGGGAAYSPGSGGAILYGVGAGVEVSPGSVGAQTPWSLPGW
ncbi:MAG: RHS repeat-associated core domain-containing protein [Thermomonas sp.]|uniref:RHS repeat-associated core domain-containing protein n=1 Tax=Thermomonas sp. TaxID=1971895 RepID=UPI0039E50C09